MISIEAVIISLDLQYIIIRAVRTGGGRVGNCPPNFGMKKKENLLILKALD